jgi:hypothetical protein
MFNNFGLNVMNLRFEYIAANTIHVFGIGRNGIESYDQNITISGAPNAVRFSAENMADMNTTRRLYFNNLKITTPDRVIVNNIEGSTFPWTIPSDIPFGNKFKIKITSEADETIFDLSDNYFTISAPGSGSITVLQPSLDCITWIKGNSYLISWVDNITGNVDIDLYKGGVFHSSIAANVVGSSYTWTIPNGTAVANNYKVKIYSHSDPSSYDFSDNNFAIQAHAPGSAVTVLQPNTTGISWLKGSTYLISWIDNVPSPMKISLYKSGLSHAVLAENVTGSTYLWTIANDGSIPTGSDYTIRVSVMNDGTIQDFSNNNFSIIPASSGMIAVLQPTVSGITWVRGNSYLISWIDNIVGTMDIKLYKGAVEVSTIATDVVGTTFAWSIPVGTVIGTDYKIKIISHDNPGMYNSSNNYFSIQDTPAGGVISVIQPNGGENWFIGNSYLISWDDNFPESVNIDLVDNTGTFISSIAGNVVGSTYVWNTTGMIIGDYKIKISSTAVPALFDMSDAVFHMLCLPAFATIYPNPANQFVNIKFDETSTDDYTIMFTDRFNMQVMARTINTETTKELQISTAELPNGVYFLTITSGKTIETKKVIVQH